MIKILSTYRLDDGSNILIKETYPYSSFLGAVQEEIRQQTTEEEKDRLIITQLQLLHRRDRVFTGSFERFAFLTSSPLVIRSVLQKYNTEQTFGIAVEFIENTKNYNITCLPIESWERIYGWIEC